MAMTALFVAVLVVGMTVITVVVALPDPRRARLRQAAEALIRYSAIASIAALSSTLMYFIYSASGSPIALALGDGAMVLAPWMVWTSLSAVNGRTRLAPAAAVVAAATSTTVSFVLPPVPSTTVKLVLVAIGCLLLGAESLAGQVRASGFYGLFTGVGLGFGTYMIARVLVIQQLGTDSLLYRRAFDTVTVTVIAAGTVVAILAAVVLLYRRLTPRPSQNADPTMVLSVALQVLTHGRPLTAYRMDVPHVALIRQTHGTAAAQTLRDALVESASACFPSGMFAVSPDGDHLVVVAAEHKGAPSRSADLARAFDAAVERARLVDLTEVSVARETVTTADELRRALHHLQRASRRRVTT